jgi:hypothetical protein
MVLSFFAFSYPISYLTLDTINSVSYDSLIASNKPQGIIMYKIIDSYGTDQTAWTYKDAQDWLAYCSPVAVIMNRFTGRILAIRTQSN